MGGSASRDLLCLVLLALVSSMPPLSAFPLRGVSPQGKTCPSLSHPQLSPPHSSHRDLYIVLIVPSRDSWDLQTWNTLWGRWSSAETAQQLSPEIGSMMDFAIALMGPMNQVCSFPIFFFALYPIMFNRCFVQFVPHFFGCLFLCCFLFVDSFHIAVWTTQKKLASNCVRKWCG